jgi:putative transcriptional regulator
MMHVPRLFTAAAALLAAVALSAFAPPAHAAEPSTDTVILVAKPALRDRLYGATVLITRPVGDRRHIGFIVNKPTPLTLGKLFPNHGPSQKVKEPVYLGGPVSPGTVFALVRRAENPGQNSMRLMSDLFLVLDRKLVDHVIEAEAAQARFFAGMVLWAPGELDTEIRRGFWYVLEADTDLVLRRPVKGMWEELVKRLERESRMIRAAL